MYAISTGGVLTVPPSDASPRPTLQNRRIGLESFLLMVIYVEFNTESDNNDPLTTIINSQQLQIERRPLVDLAS